MPGIKIDRLAVICGLVLLTFQGSAVAQQPFVPPQLIKTSISFDSDTLARKKSNIVTITVENIADKVIDIEAIGSFRLLSANKEAVARGHRRIRDGYWSPVNILSGTPLGLKIIDPEMEKKGIVVGKVPPTALHFAKGEIKTFKVDLTKTAWNDTILSGWPAETLFEVVPKGSYSLLFDMRTRGSEAKSNEIKVSVE